jgi:hypothetical protein
MNNSCNIQAIPGIDESAPGYYGRKLYNFRE